MKKKKTEGRFGAARDDLALWTKIITDEVIMNTQRLDSALCSIVMPSTPPGMGVGEAIQAIDDILRSQGSELDPQLRHYLERRSYQKALAHLRDAPPETPSRS